MHSQLSTSVGQSGSRGILFFLFLHLCMQRDGSSKKDDFGVADVCFS